MALVQGFEEIYQEHEADGFEVLSVLIENRSGEPPTVEDAAWWKEQLALSFPVLADEEHTFLSSYGGGESLFVFYLVDRDGVIVWRDLQEDGGTLEAVRTQVEALMGN